MGLTGPVVLLLGGQGKDGADYRRLRDLFENGPVVDAVVFGQAGSVIASALSGHSVHRAEKLAGAVDLAKVLAESGATVVLSPACASFDEFDDFSHRGRVFESLVAGVEKTDVEEGRER